MSLSRWQKLIGHSIIIFVTLYFLLLIPSADPPEPAAHNNQPFAWNQDDYWNALEERFQAARNLGCSTLAPTIDIELVRGHQLLAALASEALPSDTPIFDDLEKTFFELGPNVAACTQKLPEYIQLQARMRALVKTQSQHWDMSATATRDRIDRLLYGSRAALEEVLLQAPPDSFPALALGDDEPSQTPFTQILGVTVHSGDVLVSRGGAPTSALIARGNDYPGNFSHVALVHIDEKTGLASIVESHIERGVTVSTLQEYLHDKKLRVMVLRLRADLPALVADPLLPHKAAADALQRAQAHHFPYDFEMNYHDPAKLFCSEVASAAYHNYGVNLWMGISHISSPGVSAWLAAFGVRHFETQEPSDLEYDPQLRVAAEWRDPETLYQDHVDNAVVEAMLEGAERGDRLGYDWYLLPLARLAKGYSALFNVFGGIGPIPEGMNAAAALRHTQFSKTHSYIKRRALNLANIFQQKHGYRPPYWELVQVARRAKKELEE
jgi:hypothetical protein